MDAAVQPDPAPAYEGDVERTPAIVVVAFFVALALLIALAGGLVTAGLVPSGGCGGA